MGSTTRCILLHGTGTWASPKLNSLLFLTPQQTAQNGKRWAQYSVLSTRDSETNCLHLRRTVKKLCLFRYHTLSPPPPPFLPPSFEILRDWFLPRETFCSLQPKASGTHVCLNPFIYSFHRDFSLRNHKSIKEEPKRQRSCAIIRIPEQSSSTSSDPDAALLLYRVVLSPCSQGDVRVLVHQRELLTSHQPRQLCPGLTNASIAAGMASENWLSPKTCKSYYTQA